MNKQTKQYHLNEISFKASQLASSIVAVITVFLISLYTYLNQGDLSSAIKNLFPANTYIFALVLLFAFGLVSLAFLIKSKLKNVSFKKDFLIHFTILSGIAIILFGLFSKVL